MHLRRRLQQRRKRGHCADSSLERRRGEAYDALRRALVGEDAWIGARHGNDATEKRIRRPAAGGRRGERGDGVGWRHEGVLHDHSAVGEEERVAGCPFGGCYGGQRAEYRRRGLSYIPGQSSATNQKKSTNQRYTSYRTAVGARIGSACHGARRGVSVEGVAPAQPSVTCRDKQKQKINVGQPSIAAVAVDAVAVVADLAWLQHAVAARGGA